MVQVKTKVDTGFQQLLIDLMERKNIHAEAFFAFMHTPAGIEPVVVVADSVPMQKQIADELYKMFDNIFGFKETHIMTESEFLARAEEFRKVNLAK